MSPLVAALIDTRSAAEFLRRIDEPEDKIKGTLPGRTITARGYVPGWHWTKGDGLRAATQRSTAEWRTSA